jgi:hypothetical protein
MTYEVQHNRMLMMRMRDGQRWTLAYRERAWEVACEEARRRRFFASLFYFVMHFQDTLKASRLD